MGSGERAGANEIHGGPVSTEEKGLIVGRAWSPLIRPQTKQNNASTFPLLQDLKPDLKLCLETLCNL